MEQVRRIELPYTAWKAVVLPLNYFAMKEDVRRTLNNLKLIHMKNAMTLPESHHCDLVSLKAFLLHIPLLCTDACSLRWLPSSAPGSPLPVQSANNALHPSTSSARLPAPYRLPKAPRSSLACAYLSQCIFCDNHVPAVAVSDSHFVCHNRQFVLVFKSSDYCCQTSAAKLINCLLRSD